MYVYCTEAVEEAAERLGLAYNLATVIKRLENADASVLPQLFDIRYPYWKCSLRHNIRLLGDLRWLDDEPIFVLFGLWPRGGHEYATFLEQRETRDYRNWVRRLVSDEELENWLAEQQQQEDEDKSGVPLDLPLALEGWAQFLHPHTCRERLVLESSQWVKQIPALSHDQRRQVYRMVTTLVDDGQGVRYQRLPEFYPGAAVKYWDQEAVHLAFSWVQVQERAERFLFLIGVYNHYPKQQERFQLGTSTGLFGLGVNSPNILRQLLPLETWKRYAIRAYPDYMVGDEEIWLEMQAEVEGNLALSMEEEAILQEKAMPLLINGRAGSGKSLMLYYRFADYCSYYLRIGRDQAPEYKPLFLTYSPSLVRQAQDKVSKILRISHLHRAEQEFSKIDVDQCQAFFSTFHNYLLSCLPAERQEHYQPNTYINFHRFRQRYRYIPGVDIELVWHTIRTLIKGYDISGYLEPEDYLELPQGDRSVEENVFRRVYQGIWQNYHRLTTYEGYWDDLDLARDVLNNGTINPIYPVIFCDEVQDFTRVELSVILCSSPWGQFSLGRNVESLPYAFAGDPLQTVNPTGFRWSILKQYLYEHIQSYLLPNQSFNVPDVRELHNNYRCNPHITRLSNVINLWRRILLNDTHILPQEPWRPDEIGTRFAAQKFILHRDISRLELQRMLNSRISTICIIPCSLGEELDYIERDAELKAIFNDSLNNRLKPAMLQTATAVKGMEFKEIILYKFGEYYQQNFNRDLRHYAQGNIPLRLLYFLNQLYVAITRPIDTLIILDTEAGWEQFWEPSLKIDANFLLDQLGQHRQQWYTNPSLLASPVNGVINLRLQDIEDIIRTAVKFLSRGVEANDLQALRDAQSFAHRANAQALVQECDAWIAKIEGRYLEAGECFLNMKDRFLDYRSPKREAWQCFWAGQAWSKLQQYRNEFAEVSDIPDYSPLVDLMVVMQTPAPPQPEMLLSPVVRVRDWLTTDVSPKSWDATWNAGIKGFFEALGLVLKELDKIYSQEVDRKRFVEASCRAWMSTVTFPRERWQKYADVIAASLRHQKEWTLLLRVLIQRQAWEELLKTAQAQPQAWLQEHDNQLVTVLEQNPDILGQWKDLGKRAQLLFSKVVAVWEQQSKTEHSLYYRAKIELVKPPEQVKWLAKDGQHHKVISLWREQGYSLKDKWQEYADVITASLRHQKEWPLLLRVLIHQRAWEELLKTVQAQPQAWLRGHDYELLSTLARDTTTNWPELAQRFPKLRAFFREVLTSVEVELGGLHHRALELGLAYEYLGYYKEALALYRCLTDAESTQGSDREDWQAVARQRWLLVHKKYQERLQAQGQPDQRLAEEFHKKQECWGSCISQAELKLPAWHPWTSTFVEKPSPVQGWIIQKSPLSYNVAVPT